MRGWNAIAAARLIIRKNLVGLFALVLPAVAMAVASAGKEEEPLAGPRGGRIVAAAAPHAEFFVQSDRTIAVTFYDAALQPIDIGERVVNAIAEAPDGRTHLQFTRRDGSHGLVSTAPLPAGEGYVVVLQIRERPEARPTNYRVTYDPTICGGCNRAEYACTCGH